MAGLNLNPGQIGQGISGYHFRFAIQRYNRIGAFGLQQRLQYYVHDQMRAILPYRHLSAVPVHESESTPLLIAIATSICGILS